MGTDVLNPSRDELWTAGFDSSYTLLGVPRFWRSPVCCFLNNFLRGWWTSWLSVQDLQVWHVGVRTISDGAFYKLNDACLAKRGCQKASLYIRSPTSSSSCIVVQYGGFPLIFLAWNFGFRSRLMRFCRPSQIVLAISRRVWKTKPSSNFSTWQSLPGIPRGLSLLLYRDRKCRALKLTCVPPHVVSCIIWCTQILEDGNDRHGVLVGECSVLQRHGGILRHFVQFFFKSIRVPRILLDKSLFQVIDRIGQQIVRWCDNR